MDINIRPEHLGLLFLISVVLEFLKKKGLNSDYAPFVAFLLGWLGTIPIMIWQGKELSGWLVVFSAVFVEGSLIAMVSMGGYDTVKKLIGR